MINLLFGLLLFSLLLRQQALFPFWAVKSQDGHGLFLLSSLYSLFS